MKPQFGPVYAGVLSIAALCSTLAVAETVRTINGVDIDSTTIDLYIETRTQQLPEQASAEQRAALLDELIDIYLISTQERADEIAKNPRVIAQAELQYRGLLAQAVAADFIDNNAATEEEIVEEYTNQHELEPAKQYKARHILVETQSQALEIITELNGGANFKELAKTRSTGPTGADGGDLGWFSPQRMVKPFADAVVALGDGSYSEEPVQTQFGWHVILREASRDSEPPTLDSVRDTIKQRVEQTKLQKYIESLRALEQS